MGISDFRFDFKGKKSKLNREQKELLSLILDDFDSIKQEYKYNALWINCYLPDDEASVFNKIQKKRCSNILNYLEKNNNNRNFYYTIEFYVSPELNDGTQDLSIFIYYDEKPVYF